MAQASQVLPVPVCPVRHRECHPRSAAGQAQDRPPEPGQTKNRGAPAVVGQDACGTAALEQHGRGDPLCDYPLGVALPLPRRWHHRDRQQCGRAGDPADSARPQELVVRWIGQGRRAASAPPPFCRSSRPRSSTVSIPKLIFATSSPASPTNRSTGSKNCSRGACGIKIDSICRAGTRSLAARRASFQYQDQQHQRR